jgi:hypothetical protein
MPRRKSHSEFIPIACVQRRSTESTQYEAIHVEYMPQERQTTHRAPPLSAEKMVNVSSATFNETNKSSKFETFSVVVDLMERKKQWAGLTLSANTTV